MDRALDLAFGGMGRTSPNPSVGAVIVRDGKIISEGTTAPCGGDHAEVSAIKNAKGDLRGARMYVTLEPCCHIGKTPPCTKAIIESGISGVFLPLLDPNPCVAGKGVMELKQAGVEVSIMGERASKAADILRPFKKLILRKRPFVILKLALTMDGRTATDRGDSRWISGEYSRYAVHRLRSLCDAVIVGKNTLLADNPSLTVRLDDFPEKVADVFRLDGFPLSGYDNFFLSKLMGPGNAEFRNREPLRVLMGMPDENAWDGNFFRTDNYLIFGSEREADNLQGRGDAIRIIKERDAGRIVFLSDASPVERIVEAQEELARRGVMTALLEGGASLAGSFFDAGEIDQFLFFIAPLVAGSGKPAMAARGTGMMRDSLGIKDISSVWLGGDVLYGGYRDPYNFEMM